MQEQELISAKEFCTHHRIEMEFFRSVQEYELIEVISNEGDDYIAPDSLTELEKIIRLHYDLNVNMEGIDVILHLLKQLEGAQGEVNELRNRLKFYH